MGATHRWLLYVFRRVFKVSKEGTRNVGPQLKATFGSVTRIGAHRAKEFLFALPILIIFIRELYSERRKIEAQKQLIIVGAAAVLSTLGMLATWGLLSSLPFQIVILIANPFIGVPLLFSSTLVITTVLVTLIWLIIYVLNVLLSDDPVYQMIHDQFLPPDTQAILSEIQLDIEKSCDDLDELRRVVQERLAAKGSDADTRKIERDLKKIEKRIRKRAAKKLGEVVT